MQVLMILYKSTLGMDRVLELFRERMAKYQEVQGLAQKLYVSDPATGEVGGIYVFDSEERLRSFVATGLEDIRQTYQWSEPPYLRAFDLVEILRDGWSPHTPEPKSWHERPYPPEPGMDRPTPVSPPGSTVHRPIEPRK